MTIYDLPKRDHLLEYPEVTSEETKGWYEVRLLPNNIYAIAEPRHEQNGCFYLIPGKESAILFDTGLGIIDPRPLLKELYSGEIIVINSHFHFDHTGGNHWFKECYIHLDETVKKVSENGLFSDVIKEQARSEAFPLGFPNGFTSKDYGTQPFHAVSVSEHQKFNLGDREFEVIFAPGHSQDGIVLYSRDENVMFAGDVFYYGALYGQFASEEFGYSNLKSYKDTMHKLADIVNPETMVYCSHNRFIAPGNKIKEAAKLFDALFANPESGIAVKNKDLDYGEDSEIKQIFGDGFSIMYL